MNQTSIEDVRESFTLNKIDSLEELKIYERPPSKEKDGQENDDSDINVYSESKHEKSLCIIVPSRRDDFVSLWKNNKSLFDKDVFPLEFLQKPEIFPDDKLKNLTELLLKLNEILSDSNKIKFDAITLFNETFNVACNSEIDPISQESIKSYLKSTENNKQISIEFFSNEENVHVEMAVLEYLEGLGFDNIKQIDIYIATSSKPCCLCYITLKYFKNHMGLNLFYRANDNQIFSDKWNEWKNLDWPIPAFLKSYDTLFDNFAEYLQREILQPYFEYERKKYEVFEPNVQNFNNKLQQPREALEALNKKIVEKNEVEFFIRNCKDNAKKIPHFLNRLNSSDREELKEAFQLSLHYLEEK